jgi:hypothetical protein
MAGTVTADSMETTSPYFYQVAPRNERMARMMVEFATHMEIVGPESGELTTAREAVIVTDHTDEYSSNLAGDLHWFFGLAGHEVTRIYSYPAEDPEGAPAPGDVVQVGSPAELARSICQGIEDHERDIVFYTNRSQQMSGMLDSMRNDPDCPSTPTIVAGDDLSDFTQDPEVEMERYNFVRLYYTAFASPLLPVSNTAQQFIDDYRQVYGSETADRDIAVDMSDPALDYDAFLALWEAVNQASQDGLPVGEITEEIVATKLASGGEVRFNGASGFISFDADSTTARVPRNKPVLIVRAQAGGGEPPVLRCGQFTSTLEHTRWGPSDQFRCPRDPAL